MSSHMCLDCDAPGDGNCPVCHGIGKLPGEDVTDAYAGSPNAVSCALCGGSGDCLRCDGSGQVEVGGEA